MSKTVSMELTQEEAADLIAAIGMRICYTETGTPDLRQEDAIRQKKTKLLRALTRDDRFLVTRLEDLREGLQDELADLVRDGQPDPGE